MSGRDGAGSGIPKAIMATSGENGNSGKGRDKAGDRTASVARLTMRGTPEWADGLKQLYDAVLEEDLPDQFLDLLDQLDGLDGPPPGQSDAR